MPYDICWKIEPRSGSGLTSPIFLIGLLTIGAWFDLVCFALFHFVLVCFTLFLETRLRCDNRCGEMIVQDPFPFTLSALLHDFL